MRPSATASATRSRSSLDIGKAKLMPVIPVAPRACFVSDVLSRHRGTAWSHQRGERGKAGGIAHQVEQGIDAVGV